MQMNLLGRLFATSKRDKKKLVVDMRADLVFLKFIKEFAVSETFWRYVEVNMLTQVLERTRPPVLDLGCGSGITSSALFKKIDVGIDINPNVLKTARRIILFSNLLVADARNLPLPDRTFNTVFSNCAIEHIDNIEECIKEISRVLKSDGYFIFTVPSEYFGDLLLSPRKFYVQLRNKQLSHINLFSLDKWENVLGTYGLAVVDSKLYMSSKIMKLWDFLDYFFRVIGENLIGRILHRLSKNKLILPNFYKVLQREVDGNPIKIGGARLIVAKRVSK